MRLKLMKNIKTKIITIFAFNFRTHFIPTILNKDFTKAKRANNSIKFFFAIFIRTFHQLTFIIFIIILQQIDGNFIGPKILAQSTGITSFWIIFAITLFGGLFKIMGMIIGVPVTAVIISFIERITKSKLKKKELPEAPEEYLNVGKITEEGDIQRFEFL